MANIYSYDEIKLFVSCEQFLAREGIEVKGGRCRAEWRGGTHMSVAVDGGKWYDHVEHKGGSVIDLCATVKFGGDIVRAAMWLGDSFGLEPRGSVRKRPQRTRVQSLNEDGWNNTARYDYTDADGSVAYSVLRFERVCEDGTKEKTFVQCTPNHEGLDENTPHLPYNLVAVSHSQRVCIVEGEKDVETLRGLGIVASCNSGGASNFHKDLVGYFEGKDIVILPDNDEAGEKHGRLVLSLLKPVAKSIKVVRLSSLPKGDVTDWVEKEGGVANVLLERIASTKEDDTKPDPPEVAVAKAANKEPFSNYVMSRVGRAERILPRTAGDLVKECFDRFLGYPRRVSEVLFDWSRDDGKIKLIHNANALFAWIGLVSKQPVDWRRGDNLVSRGEFFESVLMRARAYSSITSTPYWPTRDDVFTTFGKLPPPDVTHSSFRRLIDFFNPANLANKYLVAAFFMAPIYYRPDAKRPMWIVDTIHQQGSGKSTLVEICAYLYGSVCITVDMAQLEKDAQGVKRRLISTDARSKRVVLFDNITTEMCAPQLAELVTAADITGLAPYGRSEESRPNDLTFVATINNANVNADIASRAYTIKLAKPGEYSGDWEGDVKRYIDANRLQIFADIIHMIENNPIRNSNIRRSRFARFDSEILSAACETESALRMADSAIRQSNDASNVDYDHGVEFSDLFRDAMDHATSSDMVMKIANRAATVRELRSVVDVTKPIFIRSSDIDWMLARSDGALKKWKVRDVIGVIRNGYVPGFDTHYTRPNTCPVDFDGNPLPKTRGLLYRGSAPSGVIEAQVVRRVNGRQFEVIGTAEFNIVNDEVARSSMPDVQIGSSAPAQNGSDQEPDYLESNI